LSGPGSFGAIYEVGPAKAIRLRTCAAQWKSKPGIDWLAFEGEDTEHALVDPAQGFFADEALQRFDAEGELPQCQGALAAQAAYSQAFKMLGQGVGLTLLIRGKISIRPNYCKGSKICRISEILSQRSQQSCSGCAAQ
jgi:hypothetical protein